MLRCIPMLHMPQHAYYTALVARDVQLHVPMHYGLLFTTMGVSIALLHMRSACDAPISLEMQPRNHRSLLFIYPARAADSPFSSESIIASFFRLAKVLPFRSSVGLQLPHSNLKIRYGVPWLASTRSIRCLPQRCVLSLCAVCAGCPKPV